MPYDRTHDCWMFPTSLFGNKRSTDGKWKRIVSHALESGSWAESLEKQPRRNVLDDACDITITSGRTYAGSRELWRMYCPHEEIARQANILDLFLRLSIPGLSELWFMVGLLHNGAAIHPTVHFDEEYREQWWAPLFRGFINWLPELEVLSPRVASIMDIELAKCIYSQEYGKGVKMMGWIDSIGCVASFLGTELLPDEIGRTYQGDLVAALLDRGVIKRNGDRFASLI
ncbi:MAG: hypothetical protein NTZ32_10770 [Planctomycetales bacterium]|nr:hypothetical protein [Planctomycetales bacterium]